MAVTIKTIKLIAYSAIVYLLSLFWIEFSIRPFFERQRWEPVVVDLSCGGLNLLDVETNEIYFDHLSNGFKIKTGWIGKDSALLVVDENQNGIIDNGKEFFTTKQDSLTYNTISYIFDRLKTITKNDAEEQGIKIWSDINQDGVTDKGELITLAQAGIDRISLKRKEALITNNNNQILFKGTYVKLDGQQCDAAVVDFKKFPTLSKWVPIHGYKPHPDVEKLPNIKSYGRLIDFKAKASIDQKFRDQLQKYVEETSRMNAKDLVSGFDELLYAWADAQDYDPYSRGQFGDARKFKFLADFYNDGFYDHLSAKTPRQGKLLERNYKSIRDGLLTRFLFGIPMSIWLRTSDHNQVYSNKFLPLFYVAVTPDNQLSDHFDNALRDVLKSAPSDDQYFVEYIEVMKAALNGAIQQLYKGEIEKYKKITQDIIQNELSNRPKHKDIALKIFLNLDVFDYD